MARTCYACGCAGGVGNRELRPYGPGGRDVCAGCVFGEDDGPADQAKLAAAEQRLALQLGMAGDVAVIDAREQAGPRAATDEERAIVADLLEKP
jgi:hypothetical protein